jgi:hypothetical protein
MKPGDISVKEFGEKASVYCYRFRDAPLPALDLSPETKGACVKHIFTGPYAEPKVQATELFYQIQEGVELSWQGVNTGIAEGISGQFICRSRQNAHLGFRPVLFLGVTPQWLARERDTAIHPRGAETHFSIRPQLR